MMDTQQQRRRWRETYRDGRVEQIAVSAGAIQPASNVCCQSMATHKCTQRHTPTQTKTAARARSPEIKVQQSRRTRCDGALVLFCSSATTGTSRSKSKSRLGRGPSVVARPTDNRDKDRLTSHSAGLLVCVLVGDRIAVATRCTVPIVILVVPAKAGVVGAHARL